MDNNSLILTTSLLFSENFKSGKAWGIGLFEQFMQLLCFGEYDLSLHSVPLNVNLELAVVKVYTAL